MTMMTTHENINIPKNQTGDGYRFIHVPLCRQETEYTCGIACVQSILGCYGIDYRQDELAKKMKSKPIFGTYYKDIISFMLHLGFKASFIENMSIDRLKSYINDGITPLLLIQAWADDGVDYASDWNDSHYVIACGYTKNRIYFMDPWTLGNYTYMSTSELLKRWHALDSNLSHHYNSGLIIKKEHCPFKYDPNVVKYLG